MEWTWFPVAVLSAVVFGSTIFWMKLGVLRGGPGSDSWMLLGLYTTGTLGFLITAAARSALTISPVVVIAGLIVGAGSVFGNLLYAKSFEYGPASLSAPLINSNAVLVVLLGVLFYAETLAFYQALGAILIGIAVVLLAFDPDESLTITDRRWYALIGVAILLFFTRNGGLKVTGSLGLPDSALLAVGYGLGVVWFSGDILKKKLIATTDHPWAGLGIGLIAGVFSFGGLQLYSVALGMGPASLISPIFAANSLIAGLLTIALLGERLSIRQGIAVVLVIAGIVLVRV